ncbi:MAG: alpha/beta hydrolase fold domain-containing protein, partial [Agrococcus sp.]
MALHPTIAEILAGFPAPEPGPLDPAAMRAGEEAHVPPLADRIPVAEVRDDEADGVPVRIYRDGTEQGVVVYVHGGAFFLGSLDTHDHVARSLAVETGMTVVSVGYRRAPEAAFPA